MITVLEFRDIEQDRLVPSSNSLSQLFSKLIMALQAYDPPYINPHIFQADPSAHVFKTDPCTIWVYGSHDRNSSVPSDDVGSQYDMADYHVLSMTDTSQQATDHGIILALGDVPWAAKQLWAPEAAYKDDSYYLYFPAKDSDGVFRIGVATSTKPDGPFKAGPEPIKNSYSIDPAVLQDDDGCAYMYFGGLWGGQLQAWPDNVFNESEIGPKEPATGDAYGPRVAKLTEDLLEFATDVQEIAILDESGEKIAATDHDRRFFEASFMHKYNGQYYFSYSTGDTHFVVYAVGDNPLGPFTYRGKILNPVAGWTSHHSIVEFQNKWWLFYHDDELSGQDNLRSTKVREIYYDDEGDIHLSQPQPSQNQTQARLRRFRA